MRQRTEEALRLSEEKFNKVFHSSPVSMVITRMRDGQFVQVNEAFSHTTGYSRDEVLNSTTIALQLWANPQDRESFIHILQQEHAVRNVKYNFRAKSGAIINGVLSAEIIQLGNEPHAVSIIEDITERERTDEALRASEASMRSLIENVKDVFIRYDLNLRYQYVSPMIRNFMDMPPESFIGKTHREAGFPEDKAEFFDANLRKAIQSKQPVNLEFSLPGRDGELILLTRVYPEFDRHGEVVSVVTVTTDITERKRMEEALEERTRFTNKLLEATALSTWISDPYGTAIQANPACYQFFGATEAETIGKYNVFQDNIAEEQNAMPLIRRAYETGEPVTFFLDYDFGAVTHVNVKKATHKFIKVILTPILDPHGRVSHVVSQSIDLTEIKQAEEALRANEARFKNSLKFSPTPIAVADHTGKLIFLNKNFIDTYGYTLQDLPTMDQWMLLAYPQTDYRNMVLQQWGQDVENAVKNNVTTPLREYQVTCKSGEIKTVEITAYFEKDLIIGHFQDITERKRTESQKEAALEKLQQAQAQIVEQQRAVAALEERERLARELHDGIGQILGYINMQTDAARELIQQGDQESATKILARLTEAAREAHEDLRGYIQKLTSTTPADRENFFSALERYCQHLRQAYLFDVSLVFPQTLPEILASAKTETHLTYIIREALSNARRYSGQSWALVTIDFDDETVQAVIEDRGIGMGDQYTGPERRTHERFGLRIMRERANESGGSLTIESAAGKGTRVIARLPRNLSVSTLTQLRILLVDDHPLFLDGLRNMLTARGAQVIGMAKDGREALTMAQTLKPDVILMDIRMPRMNGLEATLQIKAKMPQTKIMMLTSSADEADLFEALRAGASGFMLKGMRPEALPAALGSLVRGEAEFSAEMAQKILAEFPQLDKTREQKTTSEPPTETGALTSRQLEILQLVANGLTYKEIGRQLFLTERTVKYHMSEILARLHLKGRRDAEEYARRRGIK